MPVLRLITKFARVIEYPLEVETDGRPGLLRNFIFNRQIEIVCPVVQPFERVLVLR